MISVAAQLTGMHPQTLRSYEQKGLVVPQRTSGNTRMYSQADIERLELISQLTSEGINLAGVIYILDLQGRLDARDKEIDSLHRRVRVLADRIHQLETTQSVTSLVLARDMPTLGRVRK
ncbi:MAG: MerR family transcriptional regulator [Eggerthellaceae bacterium]|nr:MerR family transcriptional regulator [Eggerthellaceae bacterium]